VEGFKTPEKFPDMPWKKKPPVAGGPASKPEPEKKEDGKGGHV
jgi:hypothetical protein